MTTLEIPINQQSTGAAELIEARRQLLHGLGRPAVDRWVSAGMQMPPPELQVTTVEAIPQSDGYMRERPSNTL